MSTAASSCRRRNCRTTCRCSSNSCRASRNARPASGSASRRMCSPRWRGGLPSAARPMPRSFMHWSPCRAPGPAPRRSPNWPPPPTRQTAGRSTKNGKTRRSISARRSPAAARLDWQRESAPQGGRRRSIREPEEKAMREFVHYMLFGWYPYLAVTVLIVGSILRFDKGQYTWRSQSSQFLRRRQMILGSNLFHLGILIILVGHFVGLLTPAAVFAFVGISHGFKQMMALVVGGIAGIVAFIGCTLLLHRRLFDARVRRSSSIGDILVLVLIWLQLV